MLILGVQVNGLYQVMGSEVTGGYLKGSQHSIANLPSHLVSLPYLPTPPIPPTVD
jgi:hypothetical protein